MKLFGKEVVETEELRQLDEAIGDVVLAPIRVLGEKALVCLHLSTLPATSASRQSGYAAACARWSEKAVIRKFEQLELRGYIESGVSSRTGWITEKGRVALAQHQRPSID